MERKTPFIVFIILILISSQSEAKPPGIAQKIMEILDYHEFIFERDHSIEPGFEALKKISAQEIQTDSEKIPLVEKAKKSIIEILTKKSPLLITLKEVVMVFEQYKTNLNTFEKTEFEKAALLFKKLIAVAENNSEKSNFFIQIIEPYKKQLEELQNKAFETTAPENIDEVLRFFKLDLAFMEVLFLQYEALAKLIDIGEKRIHGYQIADISFDATELAETLLIKNIELEKMFNSFLDKPCVSCPIEKVVWGYKHVKKISHTQVQEYLNSLHRNTGYRWDLPSIRMLDAIKNDYIKNHILSMGNGFFICLPGKKENSVPIAEYDSGSSELAIYNSIGMSAVIPIRLSKTN
jgi:hypothetical protein